MDKNIFISPFFLNQRIISSNDENLHLGRYDYVFQITFFLLPGALLDATGSFQAVFSVAGSMFALAGLLHYLLPLVEKYKKKGSYFTESEITE